MLPGKSLKTKLAVLLVLFAASGGSLFSQAAVAGPKRVLKAIGSEIKATFVDMRHDPLWALYVGGTIALSAMDASTTCIGVSNGPFVETNPLLGRKPSCGKVAGLNALATITELTAMHKLRSGFYGKCKRDAANPDSLYNHIAESRGISPNPERCRMAMDLAGMPAWTLDIMNVKNNIDLLTWKGKP
jgi:hypothetical protein